MKMRLFNTFFITASLVFSNFVLEASAAAIKPIVKRSDDGAPYLEFEIPSVDPPEPLHASKVKRDSKEDYSLVVDETFYWTFKGTLIKCLIGPVGF